jgi:hypothetical protein
MIWFAVFGGIAAWLIHLTAGAALIRLSCDHRDVLYVIHAVTAAAVMVTLVAMRLSWRLRTAPDDSRQFLGSLGLLIGGTNVVLILLEGSFVLFLSPCA